MRSRGNDCSLSEGPSCPLRKLAARLGIQGFTKYVWTFPATGTRQIPTSGTASGFCKGDDHPSQLNSSWDQLQAYLINHPFLDKPIRDLTMDITGAAPPGFHVVEFSGPLTILMTHDVFATFGYGFSDISALAELRFYALTIPIMGGLVSFIGQSFYAYRIYVISASGKLIPAFIIILSLTSSVGAFISAGFGYKGVLDFSGHPSDGLTQLKSEVWLAASALSDIVIAGSMTYYLSTAETAIRQTRVLLSKLIRLVIETGAITALATLLSLTLFYAFPNRSYDFVPGLIIPKLYANTILAVLNSRAQIVGGRGTYISLSDIIFTVPSLHVLGKDHSAAARDGSGSSHSITVNREGAFNGRLDEHIEMKGTNVWASRVGDDDYV
ncbi:hypothetical protein C8F04DRAFT_1187355 [Mycena alexandri]|uniref:DUF6534 domain-containing protein n=1 Tax=Mycena alexandri TaxID=1745969 RepID=A0AAD6SP28_9AGAR|nr:hypothetical protein C8F04DRAFT_1187355 [Mycena alexandri]